MSGKSAEGLSEQVQELVDKAQRLSAAERARLVGEILESLDEPDPAVDSAWREEVERRAEGMDDGTRRATPWDEARKKLGA